MVKISSYLDDLKNNKSNLQMRYYADDNLYGVNFYYHGFGIIRISFDPWSGKEIFFITDDEWIKDYKNDIETEERLFKETGADFYFYNAKNRKLELKKILNNISADVSSNRQNWDKKINALKSQHIKNNVCEGLLLYLKGGYDAYLTSIIHIPNIRTYAILNKKEYGGFEPIDYCPFCGAEFPKRLDKKLEEILISEYGLNSWKDYKKAPPEFKTDEWWKKRGL